ncbi:GNAT family N-acetyltransferase [Dermatophilus congolensis]|uniref:N-acetyltransferase domain-containing protein n=1 Tax=Dermatophilus congolensis TaxID=1863 RepID=A0A239V9P0_9MICO|nr:GNAT family N-acetyltransferase [Dermatophilus congolensis]MBO3130453.1 N-acetyltransferase [Dermatophilus congolensis]MBO3130917.1 N-acetyltransferase [Dermatophilus congolensis]MBO3134924.1 N-acetyltransferase [Dermatophilus congolensis]MBO3137164.1 N-acetyltransferase [Dermatophilus congolensis]MBO3139407.1 N-acetyltransferase [Dermatophilus congolensis]
MSEISVTDNPSETRYEARHGGTLAGIATYITDNNIITFTHVIVLPEFEGKGIGTALVEGALEDVKIGQTYRVVPECSFMRKHIQRNSGRYDDILANQ